MAALVDVTIDSTELGQAIDRWAKKGRNLRPQMAVVGEMLVAAVNDKFEASGPGWPPLSEATLRRRRGSTAQILVDTGRLAGSIRAESAADFAEVFTDVSYAVYHVSSKPRSRIPLRDFFDLPERVFEDIEEYLLEELANA